MLYPNHAIYMQSACHQSQIETQNYTMDFNETRLCLAASNSLFYLITLFLKFFNSIFFSSRLCHIPFCLFWLWSFFILFIFILFIFYFFVFFFWSSSILVIFHFGYLPFWLSSILVVFHLNHLPFWLSSILVIFHFVLYSADLKLFWYYSGRGV